MRPRKHDRHLPACMYLRHGAYWYVKRGKWTRLGTDYGAALQEYASLVQAPRGGMPELIDKVLAEIEPTLAASTVSQYRLAAARLKEMFAEFAPEQVKPRHVAEVKVALSDTPNMANRILSVLRVVFAHAVEWQLVDSNPCVGVRRHAEKRRDRLMTNEEFRAISAAAEHRAIPIVMLLCLLTGQRIGDVLRLRNEHIGQDGITFSPQKTRRSTGARVLVEMTPDLAATIARAREVFPRQIGRPGTYETLLYTRGGRPYSYGTIRDAFDRAKTAAKVTDVTLHDIRAKSATDAAEQGLDPQRLLAHSQPGQTSRYLRSKAPVKVRGPAVLDSKKERHN